LFFVDKCVVKRLNRKIWGVFGFWGLVDWGLVIGDWLLGISDWLIGYWGLGIGY
jgi:hypothetical protein